ncbi:MAG TPA: DUF4360 domain-containing protein [Polyangiaceae bacterium]|nr:DUF4360 domain-containing protein [Polyangiaceae bacterium]
MHNPNPSCLQASLIAWLPLLGAACLWGCSGEVSEQSKQDPASVATTLPGAQGGSSGSGMPTPSVSSTASAASELPVAPAVSGTAARPEPPTADVSFSAKILSVNGSGCPSGSATITATTADSLTLNIPAYSARLGGEADSTHKRQNCLLVFDVDVPVGFTYAVTSASLSGTAALPVGASASATTQYFFAGGAESVSNTQPINGDTSGWTSPGVFPPASLVYAPCDAPSFLSFNTSLMLTGESDVESTISLDPSVTLKFALKKCLAP